MKHIYITTGTYSFSSDYITKPFKTELEALTEMNKLIDKEVETVRKESGYTPTVVQHRDDDVEIVYKDGDSSYYRVLKVEMEE